MLNQAEKVEYTNLNQAVNNENAKKAIFLEEFIKLNTLNNETYPISKIIYQNFLNFQNQKSNNLNFLNSNKNNNNNNFSNNYFKENLGCSISNLKKSLKLELFQTLEHKETNKKVWQIAWHPQDDLFATCGEDKSIYIWGFNISENKYSIKAILEDSSTETISSITWDNSGNYLASTSFLSSINIWKKEGMDFDCISTLEGLQKEIKTVTWSVSGKYLANCSKEKTIWIWHRESEEQYSCDAVIDAHENEVRNVKWSPVDEILFSSGFDNCIKIWGMSKSDKKWNCLNTLNGHKSIIRNFELSKDSLFLISVSDDKSLILWKIEDLHYKKIILIKKIENINDRFIQTCCLNFKQDIISTGSSDNSIKLLKLDKKNSRNNVIELTSIEKAHDDDINFMSFHNTKNIFVSCSDDAKIKIWKIVEF